MRPTVCIEKGFFKCLLPRLRNVAGFGFKKNHLLCLLPGLLLMSLMVRASDLPPGAEVTGKKMFLPGAHADIRGRILSSNGEPVAGANVKIAGQSTGTTTNDNGEFVINANVGDKLEISRVGFETMTVAVKNDQPLEVTLNVFVAMGEEVVVVGYGTQKKINLTGAVTQVKGKDVENRMTPNLVSSLQGLIPNLNLSTTARGGEPGADPAFNIRGTGSLSGGSPFVLIDGVPQDMNSVNPNDIESISVLKDASASAIYGVRAAYGVILITTKKGKNGKPVISYSANAAWQKPTTLPKMLNSVDNAVATNESYINSGLAQYYTDAQIALMRQYIANPGSLPVTVPNPTNPNNWDVPYANVDQYDVFYKDFAFNQDHSLSISGGGSAVTYFLSGGFYDQGSQFRYGNESYKRFTVTSNVTARVTDWMRVGLNTKYTKRATEMPHVYPLIGSFYHDIPRRDPNFPEFDANGHYYTNTLALMAEGGKNKVSENQLLNSLVIEIEPVKNWKINADVNLRMNFNNRSDHTKTVYRYFVDNTPFPEPYSIPNEYLAYNYRSNFNSNNIYTSYENKLDKHYFKIMAGVQSELSSDESFSITRNQLITDNVPFITTATGALTTAGSKGHWATLGAFSRLNYSFDDKFLLELSSRYDGSSRFEDGRRWGFFPSISGGYNLGKEQFFKNLLPMISMFKLRASYGTLGNQNISQSYYPYLPSLGINTNLNWIMGSERPLFITAPGLVSPDITWEKATTLNFGLDVEALRGRMSMSLDIYERATDQMVGPAESYPGVLGTTAPRRNNASLSTKGFELSLGWQDRVGEFSYKARVYLSDNYSTVTKYKNLSGTLNDHYEGKRLGEVWGLVTAGIYQTADEVSKGPDQSRYHARWQPGDVQYTDLNGDGKINTGSNTLADHGDSKVIGNIYPRYSYGVSLGAEWRGIYIEMLWQGVMKQNFWDEGNFFWGFGNNINATTLFDGHLDTWRPTKTNAYFPIAYITSENNKNRQVQTRFLQDNSYLRLKNLQLGYNLPPAFTGKFGVGSMRVYFTGENMLTFTKLFKVFDPETTVGGEYAGQKGKVYPLATTYSFGINVNLK
jgi:TonB-linked SusC/RagA family outer membrane protein